MYQMKQYRVQHGKMNTYLSKINDSATNLTLLHWKTPMIVQMFFTKECFT